MPRVVHFELPADDVERAIKFYEDVFGWHIEQWPGNDYWLISTGDDPEPGIDGALMPRTETYTVVCNIIDVESVDESLAKIQAAGGTIVVPKMPVPGVGWLAYFTDTEGNFTGLMESDPEAK
jgi:uncharacterized protein